MNRAAELRRPPRVVWSALGHMVTLNNFDSTAKQLSVSGVGLNPHLTNASLLTDNVHIENGDKTVPRLLKYLIIVCSKYQTSRLKLLATIKNRQLDLHRHSVSLDVFDNSMKLGVVNVDVGNFHARNVA